MKNTEKPVFAFLQVLSTTMAYNFEIIKTMKNATLFLVNSINELEEKYKFKHHLKYGLVLDKTKIPEQCWLFIPYVECLYSKDQRERENLSRKLPKQLIADFRELLKNYDNILGDWQGGDEVLKEGFSDEYIAFGRLRMYYLW